MAAVLLACDWGTTNLRAWTLDARGEVVDAQAFPCGVSALARGEAATRLRDTVRPALKAEALPAILCGMIGSNLGWRLAPYVDCPADMDDLAAGFVEADAGHEAWIVPGLRCQGLAGAPDVLRGEETQLFGWLAGDPARRKERHIVCHPGTHAKWSVLEDGRVVRFLTAMTGELFAVLSRHSVLKSDADADNEPAFAAGVAAAGAGDALSARLFGARARVVGGDAPADSTRSYLSGLLIGAEVASLPGLLGAADDAPIVLLGDLALCARYARALDLRGRTHTTFDGEAAAIRGLFALHSLARDR